MHEFPVQCDKFLQQSQGGHEAIYIILWTQLRKSIIIQQNVLLSQPTLLLTVKYFLVDMRPTTLQLLTASLLVANLGFAQGHLPPPWAGKPNGLGPPGPDPLASGNYWGSTPPVPIQDGGRQFGNLPPGFHPMQPGGPPHSDGHGGGSGADGAPKDIYSSGNQGFPQHIGIPGAPPSVADTIALVPSGGLQLENDYPMHPTQVSMYTYVPQTFKKGNPVVVALHPCGGSALRYFGENRGWTHAADLKGFMMIYPSSPPGTNGCWDVSSEASLKHDGGGDSQSAANMVKYAQQKYGCSEHQVYVIGHSSGAMLTQVLGVTYPDVFLAAAAISGVPAGCFRTVQVAARDNNATCTGGALHESPDYWVKQARNMYPVSWPTSFSHKALLLAVGFANSHHLTLLN